MYSLLPPATVPLPIWVVKNGICSRRTKPPRPAVLRGRLAAAPSMISGRFASRIMPAARSSALRCATGHLDRMHRHHRYRRRRLSRDILGQFEQHRPRPLLHRDPERVAHQGRNGTGTDDLPCDSLVSGLNAPTTSTIWNRACRLLMMPFCPVIMIIGMAPSSA